MFHGLGIHNESQMQLGRRFGFPSVHLFDKTLKTKQARNRRDQTVAYPFPHALSPAPNTPIIFPECGTGIKIAKKTLSDVDETGSNKVHCGCGEARHLRRAFSDHQRVRSRSVSSGFCKHKESLWWICQALRKDTCNSLPMKVL